MLDDGWKNETVLVQGIIDAYFMEGDEIVLVDYKTDRVKRGQEQKLIDLYHVQLEDYARALERDRKSTRLNSSHWNKSRMPSSA